MNLEESTNSFLNGKLKWFKKIIEYPVLLNALFQNIKDTQLNNFPLSEQ